MKKISLIFGLFLLSSCAVTKMGANLVRPDAQTANERARRCLKKVVDNPAFQSLAAHTPIDTEGVPTDTQLTDNGVPNYEDTKKLIDFHNETEPCKQQLAKDYMEVSPRIASLLIDGYKKGDLITADLIQHKITWGEANKKHKALTTEITEKLTAATKDIDGDSAKSHGTELERRKAAFNAWTQ